MQFSIKKSLISSIFTSYLAFSGTSAFAADTCTFTPSGQTLPANGYYLKKGSAPAYRLMMGDQIFKYPSVNIFDLFNRYLSGDRCGGKKYLHSAAAAGFKSARFFSVTYDEASVQFPGMNLWKQNPQAFFTLVDQLIADAREAGIYLIPALGVGVFNMNETTALASAGCTDNFSLPFIPGSANRTDMKNYMSDWSRRYANNQTILFWELGNELNLQVKHRSANLCVDKHQMRAYIDEMSTAIKSFDSNHMVAAGTMQEGDVMSLSSYMDWLIHYNNLPNIDFVTLHLYGSQNEFSLNNNQKIPVDQFLSQASTTAHSMGKALWVGEYGTGSSWETDPLSNFVQSLHLAKGKLGVDLLSAWNWDNAKYAPSNHPEQVAFSINTTNTLAISGVTQRTSRLGIPLNLNWKFVTADFNGDKKSDIVAYSDHGLFQVSLTSAAGAQIPSQWLNKYADKKIDVDFTDSSVLGGDFTADGKADLAIKTKSGKWYIATSTGSGFQTKGLWLTNFGNLSGADQAINAGIQLFSGDWNNDKKSDIGFKTIDGRWYIALSNGASFNSPALWLSNFGNEFGADAVINAGTQVITGDWNGDLKSDIGFKAKDGRWYVALSDGTKFTQTALWLTGYGNEYGPDLALNAGTIAMTGDWDGDLKTDIGFKTKDGRWYLAFSRTNHFADTWLWHTGLGNEYSISDPGQQGGTVITGNWVSAKSSFGYRTSDGRIYVNFTNFPSVNVWEWLTL